jgi:hypothetical protein
MCLYIGGVAQMNQAALRAQMGHGIHDCAYFIHVTVDEKNGGETEKRESMGRRARCGTTSDYKAGEWARRGGLWRIDRRRIRWNGCRGIRVLLLQGVQEGIPDPEYLKMVMNRC